MSFQACDKTRHFDDKRRKYVDGTALYGAIGNSPVRSSPYLWDLENATASISENL